MRAIQLTLADYCDARLRSIAYADGFAHGTDPARAERSDVVGATASADWWRGLDDGRRAAESAEKVYREHQLDSLARERRRW